MGASYKMTQENSCYEIHLRPTVIFHNSLPATLLIESSGTMCKVQLHPGESKFLSSVEPGISYVIMTVILVLGYAVFLYYQVIESDFEDAKLHEWRLVVL